MPQPPPPTAFISGASSGIGRAIAEKLLAENHRVWGTSRDPARLASLAQKHPTTFTPVALDLDNPDTAQAAYKHAAAEASTATGASARQRPIVSSEATGSTNRESKIENSFDLVINNAGYGLFSPYATADFAIWQRQLDAMLITTARLAHTALRGMIARNHGTLVNVSSLAVNFPLPYMSAYNIAKAGLSALNESLIFETRGTNITIIDFRPGDYRTAFNDIMRPGATANAATQDSGLGTQDSALQPFSPSALSSVWRTLDTQFNTAPRPDRAARDLYRAIQRGRSGTVTSGRFFQARLAPLAARLLPATLMRSLQARYFGAK